MHIFEFNDEIETYTYPIIKIIVCVVIYIALFYRDKLLGSPKEPAIIILIYVIVAILAIGCICCLELSFAEMLALHMRRVEAKRDVEKLRTKKYAVDDIVAMAEQEDILEIEIKFDGKIVKVGSSSDSCPGRSDFFDKAYFCNAGKLEEMESIEEFRERLEVYSTEGVLEVFSIDGLPVVDKKKKRINK